MQFGELFAFERVEGRPDAVLLDAFHKEVVDPQRREEIVRATALFAGVFLEVEEIDDVHVPRFEVDGDGAFARTELIDGDGDVVGDLQERDGAAGGVFMPVDERAHGAYLRPVPADSAAELGE